VSDNKKEFSLVRDSKLAYSKSDTEELFRKYKNLYRDIIFGYSEKSFESDGEKVFIKHLNDLETGQSERNYQNFLLLGQEKGLKTEKDSVDFLIEEGVWEREKEEEISELQKKLSELEAVKDKLVVLAQLERLKQEIKPISDQLYLLNYERTESMGMTAETFANKKISETTIQSCFFKDKEFSKLFFTEEDWDYLPQERVNESLSLYSGMISKDFGGDEIRRVSVCPFFMNYYVLCDDNVYSFFGKPILSLTNFQVALSSHAKYFKSLMGNYKSPPEDYRTPDKIIEWYELQSKSEQAKNSFQNKGEAGGKSLFGASKDELEALETQEEGVMDLNKEIDKHGGNMDMEQILKMHGL
jgi:hypothetical protein